MLESRTEIVSATGNSFKWNTIGQAIIFFISFVVSIILARLLEPADFGLFAVLAFIGDITSGIVNLGLSASIINKQNISKVHLDTSFTYTLFSSMFLALLLFFFSEKIGVFFNNKTLIGITKWYSVVIFFNSISYIHNAILIKELKFKTFNLILIVAKVLSAILAIFAAAKLNMGVGSLVLQVLVNGVVIFILLILATKYFPVLRFKFKAFKELFSYGSNVFIVMMLDKVFYNIDNSIVGKFYSPDIVGFFNRAKSLMYLPVNLSRNILSSVVFPVFSKINNEKELIKIFDDIIWYVSFFASVLVGIMILEAKTLIVLLYSDKWLPSVNYFYFIGVLILYFPLNSVMVQTILSRGKSKLFMFLEALKKIFLFISFAGIFINIQAFLVFQLVVYFFSLIATVFFVSKVLMTPFATVLKNVFSPVIMSIVVFIVLFIVKKYIDISGLLSDFLFYSFLYLVAYLPIVFIFNKKEVVVMFNYVKRMLKRR